MFALYGIKNFYSYYLNKFKRLYKYKIKLGYKEQQELLAKTSQELNKTKEMLVMQHKINKDYHQEVVEIMSNLFLMFYN